MSFLMNALNQYNAVLGLNGANYAMMQNNQRRVSLANSASTNFGSAKMDSFVRADKKMEMDQAVNGLNAKVYNVQLDSLEKARKNKAEGFDTFA